MKRLFLFFLFFFLAEPLFAIRLNTIYQADIPVVSQSASERDKLIQDALEQVLSKVNGKETILNNENIKAHLKDAPLLMQEYAYAPFHSPTNPYLLTVRFDPESVNQLLRNANEPIWGVDRPLILAWVEYEVPNKPAEIIDSNSQNEIQTLFKLRAEQRGIPFMLPVMDVTDLNLVGINDIVTMNTDILLAAAKRYDCDGILIARIFQLTDGFSIQAKLKLGKDSWDWNVSGNNITVVISQLMTEMTATLASRYSTVVSNSVQTHFLLKVTGVRQQDDYVRLMRYIQHIATVASVEPTKISDDYVVLSIHLRGTKKAFTQSISLDKKLTQLSEQTNPVLVYQWNH